MGTAASAVAIVSGATSAMFAHLEPHKLVTRSDGFIDPMWRELIPFQDFGDNPNGLIYYLTNNFHTVEVPGGFGQGQSMTLEVCSQAIGEEEFIYDDTTIAQAVKDTIMSFPNPELHHNGPSFYPNGRPENAYTVFEVRANCNRVAMKTRRGAANCHMYDSWFYRGKGPVDSPIIIATRNDRGTTRYAIWKSEQFDNYGFHLDAPVGEVIVGLDRKIPATYNIHQRIDEDGYVKQWPDAYPQQFA